MQTARAMKTRLPQASRAVAGRRPGQPAARCAARRPGRGPAPSLAGARCGRCRSRKDWPRCSRSAGSGLTPGLVDAVGVSSMRGTGRPGGRTRTALAAVATAELAVGVLRSAIGDRAALPGSVTDTRAAGGVVSTAPPGTVLGTATGTGVPGAVLGSVVVATAGAGSAGHWRRRDGDAGRRRRRSGDRRLDSGLAPAGGLPCGCGGEDDHDDTTHQRPQGLVRGRRGRRCGDRRGQRHRPATSAARSASSGCRRRRRLRREAPGATPLRRTRAAATAVARRESSSPAAAAPSASPRSG